MVSRRFCQPLFLRPNQNKKKCESCVNQRQKFSPRDLKLQFGTTISEADTGAFFII